MKITTINNDYIGLYLNITELPKLLKQAKQKKFKTITGVSVIYKGIRKDFSFDDFLIRLGFKEK